MKRAEERLKRRSVYVDEEKLNELTEILNVDTNSKALREAAKIVVSGKKNCRGF
jgi:hypothetical protein